MSSQLIGPIMYFKKSQKGKYRHGHTEVSFIQVSNAEEKSYTSVQMSLPGGFIAYFSAPGCNKHL